MFYGRRAPSGAFMLPDLLLPFDGSPIWDIQALGEPRLGHYTLQYLLTVSAGLKY